MWATSMAPGMALCKRPQSYEHSGHKRSTFRACRKLAVQPRCQQDGKLFSNLRATNTGSLVHDQGSVLGSALLVAGTTVGAGILALPAVTQEAGFVPAATTLTACCLFSAATGLLIAEVNISLMRQGIGAGNVSLVTMARQTIGESGSLAASAAYVFLHYALLVAYISKAGEIVGAATGLPLLPSAALFASCFAVLCYASSQKLLDQLNGVLVVLVVASFLGLLGMAAPGVDSDSLFSGSNWGAVPATLPVVALAFVYHNIIPVISNALEGDVAKIRTAVLSGLAIPWAMFIAWEAAILGSLGSLGTPVPQPGVEPPAAVATLPAAVKADTSVALQLASLQPAVAPPAAWPVQQAWQQQQQLYPPAVSSLQAEVQVPTQQLQLVSGQPSLVQNLLSEVLDGGGSSLTVAPTRSNLVDSSSQERPHVDDPLAALSASNASVAPLIQSFSFLAIATSYIGFILGLTGFLTDALSLPSSRQALLPYALTVLPPFGVAVTNPDIFLQALDTAGTYGVLTLFGILPAAMAWSARYNVPAPNEQLRMVPGGKPCLLAIAGAAAGVIANEVVQLVVAQPGL